MARNFFECPACKERFPIDTLGQRSQARQTNSGLFGHSVSYTVDCATCHLDFSLDFLHGSYHDSATDSEPEDTNTEVPEATIESPDNRFGKTAEDA